MGAWEIFSYYGYNERITLVRDAGAGVNMKHKIFYALCIKHCV
jgi:hypothetical protein